MIEENRVFGVQKKQKYGMFSNACYHLRAEWEADKGLVLGQCGMILPTVAGAFLGALLPSEAVRGLEEGWPMGRLILWLTLLAGILWICHVTGQALGYAVELKGNVSFFYYKKKVYRKIMYMDYDVMEQGQSVSGNVWKALRSGDDFQSAAKEFLSVAIGLIGMVFYGIFIISRNWVLLVLMSVIIFLKSRLSVLARRKHREEHGALSRYAKEAAYISRQSRESRAGKDIRIYGMGDLFLEKYGSALKGMDRIFKKIHNWYLGTGIAITFGTFVLNSAAYLYLTYLVAKGEMSASAFVLYIGLVAGFSDYFGMVNRSLMNLNPFCVSVSYIREFLEVKDKWPWRAKMGQGQLARLKAQGVKVEFRDVSYTYAGKENPALSHINLTIHAGEKLALLGLNGAGKTTLVKLLCGFYEPTEGMVLLNDIPVRNYNREEYYSLIAVLFQDATLLPFSLDENLTGGRSGETDRKWLESALALSGFREKYYALPKQGGTRLVKEVNPDALDFSGGERQKMLFARALYKDAPLLILDEPTAALDPIAENELYRNFGEAAKGRTTVYISHRLSSTRFCDRIVLLEHGRIVEEGTHASLMESDTRYARLYELQSQYYRDEKTREKRAADMGDLVT